MASRPDEPVPWRDAVWRAAREEGASGPFTRQEFLARRLPGILEATRSKGLTPDQTTSRVLQELRDAGALVFLGGGRYALARDSAEAPSFKLAVATQREALVQARVGQGGFRKALLERFGGRCGVTGVADPDLLRASHIVPWAACEDEADRLRPDNGVLLSALWDAAFDGGAASFDDAGAPPSCCGTALPRGFRR